MQNAAPLYCTIKKIQRFEDRVIWRCYGRFSRTITRDYAVFFSRAGTDNPVCVYRHKNKLNFYFLYLHFPAGWAMVPQVSILVFMKLYEDVRVQFHVQLHGDTSIKRRAMSATGDDMLSC